MTHEMNFEKCYVGIKARSSGSLGLLGLFRINQCANHNTGSAGLCLQHCKTELESIIQILVKWKKLLIANLIFIGTDYFTKVRPSMRIGLIFSHKKSSAISFLNNGSIMTGRRNKSEFKTILKVFEKSKTWKTMKWKNNSYIRERKSGSPSRLVHDCSCHVQHS